MTNINEILARAAALRDETALNSIDPERAGGIMYDTLMALNELWLQQGAALVISKIYTSVASMEADDEPVSDISGQPLRAGQIVVIASSDSDNGSVYRFGGISEGASVWALVGTIGGVPCVDSLDSDSTVLPLAAHQGKVLDGKISERGVYAQNEEWVRVVVDSHNRILYGVTSDGAFHVGSKDVSDILKPLSKAETEQFLSAVVDEAGKIVEGITPSGEKFIGKFSGSTKKTVVNLDNGEFYIENLDSSFDTPLDFTVEQSSKGMPDAKYVFHLPVSRDEYNIRFKFQLQDALINSPGTFKIADWNGIPVMVTAVGLSQATKNYTIGGVQKTSYLPFFLGGLSFNGADISGQRFNKNLGPAAFSVQYTGESSEVSISNSSGVFSVNMDGVTSSFPLATYDTLEKLYSALSQVEGLSVQCNSLEGLASSLLAEFPETKLVGYFYGSTDGQGGAEHEYEDNPTIYLPLAIDKAWHQVEIVRIGGVTVLSVDGITTSTDVCLGERLELGGGCGVLFKELHVHTNSPADAEVVSGSVVSGVNPSIVILEGHGIEDVPSEEMSPASLSASVERLCRIYSHAFSKGYAPVTIQEIGDYYAGTRELPKRCFTIVFDDYQYANVLDASLRRVHTRYGVRVNLAVITDREEPIYHDGVSISKKEASIICDRNGCSVISHTRNHRRCTDIAPSSMQEEFEADLYSADLAYASGVYMVYPYGSDDSYINEVLSWLGYRLGIGVDSGNPIRKNIKATNPYHLVRKDVGIRTSLEYIFNSFI